MYLYYDSFRKLCRTNNINNAEVFETDGKAYNVLMCSFPKKQREGWKVISVGTNTDTTEEVKISSNEVVVCNCDGIERVRSNPIDENIDEKYKPNWDFISKELKDMLSTVSTYKDKIYKELIDVEAELCDCEHACEFFKLNAVKGYKLYSMIRERRIKRRQLKDEYRRAMAVLNMSSQNIVDGKLEKVFKEIDEQAYEPRILKKLFQI